jgi:predicted Rdx family selenoprotein
MSENQSKQEVCIDCDPSITPQPANVPTVEDPLNTSTFVAPTTPQNPTLVIEYCDRVRILPVAGSRTCSTDLALVPMVSLTRSSNTHSDGSGVHRLHRATWIATEISITFPSPMIRTISLVATPAPAPAGRFRVWLLEDPNEENKVGASSVIWDRKVDNGFPELKALVRA